jgi:hypothetical protein
MQLGKNGVFTTPKGNFYEGEWADNKMHGHGTFNWVGTNNVYTGEYLNGRKEGYGKYFFNYPIRFYEGKWLHDKPHGRGEIHTEEKIVVGLFRYGKLVQVYSEATLGGNDNGHSSNTLNNEIVLKKDDLTSVEHNLVFLKEDVNTRFLSHLRRSEDDNLPTSPSKKYKPVGMKNYNTEENLNMNYNQDLKKIRDGEKIHVEEEKPVVHEEVKPAHVHVEEEKKEEIKHVEHKDEQKEEHKQEVKIVVEEEDEMAKFMRGQEEKVDDEDPMAKFMRGQEEGNKEDLHKPEGEKLR